MKKKILGMFVCMLLIAATVLPVAGTINKRENSESILFDDNTNMKFAPGEVIVKLKKDTTFSRSPLTALNEKHQVCALEKVFPNAEGTILDNIYLVHVPIGSDILSIVREYASCPDVAYAEPNGVGGLCGIPNDANFSIQWSLHNTGQMILNNISGTPDADIDAPEAWDIETGSSDVIVAIIDTGIDYTHPDLAAKIWNNTDEIPGNGIDDDINGYIDDVMGWDFASDDNDPKDGYGHGTLCAGVAGAVTNNGIGIAGVGWNCTVMPVQVINESGWGDVTMTAKGIRYAADNGADICSISLAWRWSFILKNAVDYAYGKGVFLCAAAGNGNSSQKLYPAAYEHVVAVAATNQNDGRCTPEDWGPREGSEYGDWVDIAAPGNKIYTTMPTYHVVFNDYGYKQNYDYLSGTSLSSPMVAGVAALLLSKKTWLSPDDVRTLICENADPYNSTEYIGTGRINAQKALAAIPLSDVGIQIKGGLGVIAVLTNHGTTNVGVSCQIHVEGGILGRINKTNGICFPIPAGESETMWLGGFFGLGPIAITVKVDDYERTAKGIQFIIFSIVK